MITRIFRATVHEGKQREFEEFFVNVAAPLVRSQPGLLSLAIGRPLPETPHDFVMIMNWEDTGAIRAFAGENWREAVILEEERDLLRKVSVAHYEVVDMRERE